MKKELSLFTGAGGGILAGKLLGWKTIGYVEYNDYCQKIIKQRITDGIFDTAPIFSDIRAFNSEGYAREYKGMVDVITAGFPCQPFSISGKRRGVDDERNMWPEAIRTIREVEPREVLLENVPGLLGSGYFGTIIGELSESGYDCRWRILSAGELGAPHKRERVWIYAYSKNNRPQKINKKYLLPHKEDWIRYAIIHSCKTWDMWENSPEMFRDCDGVANRSNRLTAIGNGQVPIVAATAWRMLAGTVN